MPRKTDSKNPADWLFIAAAEVEGLRVLAEREVGYSMCRSKLAEVLEKILKAELIRTGWALEKTHDLNRLFDLLAERNSDLLPTVEPLCDVLVQVYFTDRYPGFDLDDPDWPALREQLKQVEALLETVKSRLVVK
ncbi:MAG: HEPN domain-containing protein [Verrucomicrobia bacterium]|nr:HEPN domain-containing protein [Verrucomicrobiota bacterium]